MIQSAMAVGLVTALVAPGSLYLLRRHDERRQRDYAVRLEEYRAYLKTLEGMVRSLRSETRLLQESFEQHLGAYLAAWSDPDLEESKALLVQATAGSIENCYVCPGSRSTG
jgi:hypothetical protein